MKLRTGDWVVVRSKEEILRSLDPEGRLEGLPFMPQMFQYCGQRFRVYKRAHKTCDTVTQTGGRRLSHAVHLELRCDGEAYGGCQAACLIFWKQAWLKPVHAEEKPLGGSAADRSLQNNPAPVSAGCTEIDVAAGTRAKDQPDGQETRYVCQATELPHYTTLLPWWDAGQYLEDYTSGNVSLATISRGLLYAGYYSLVQSGIGLGRPLRWLYNRSQALWGGIPYPRLRGKIPVGQSTPARSLDLQPGELVRVKSYEEILATLDAVNKNHGLTFDAEMVPYCGGSYRVRTRVSRFIDEKTGRMLAPKNVSVILEDVWCRARYSDCRMFCPRSIYSWWREVWLERIPQNPGVDAKAGGG